MRQTVVRTDELDRPIRFPISYPEPGTSSADRNLIAHYALWPIVCLLIIHHTVILITNGNTTNDFYPIWKALEHFASGENVYSETYYLMDPPHYFYSPGGTVLLSPLVLLHNEYLARAVYAALNVIGIITALGIMTRIVNHSLRSYLWPLSCFLAFLTETVTHTLAFTNINGLLLLGVVAFLLFIFQRKWFLAGLVLGLAITIKPIVLPLLFIPLIKHKRGWETILAAVSVPVMFNIIGWIFVSDAGEYIHHTIPYLRETRDYANSSIQGQGFYLGMPPEQLLTWRIVVGIILTVGLLCLTIWHKSDEVMWACTTAGLLISGVFALSNLGQMYYSMLIFPLLFTVYFKRSAMHNPLTWIATYFFLSLDNWSVHAWENVYWLTENLRPMLGWTLFIICVSGTAIGWFCAEKRRPASPPVWWQQGESTTRRGAKPDESLR